MGTLLIEHRGAVRAPLFPAPAVGMNVARAKRLAREWVEENLPGWPGLRAAHLVGGITTMPADASFPTNKDVDMHLIFDEGSPMLHSSNPFMNILEASFGGVSIEAGVKSVVDYRSAEAVLANPEIAHHLTVDSVLFDPTGLLRDVQREVRWEYPRRHWVLARVAHERRAQAEALALRPMAAAMWGASGEVNILGYSTTFANAALWVAALQPPRMGGRMFLQMRDILAVYGRLDLHEEMLALLGLDRFGPARAARLLGEVTEAFDLAVTVRQSPYPFGHKLHPHLRPYLVETCQGMLDEGRHREAVAWMVPYQLATTAAILADGPDAEKPRFAARQAAFLADLGLDTAEALDARFAQAGALYDRIFALAEEIVASNPGVLD